MISTLKYKWPPRGALYISCLPFRGHERAPYWRVMIFISFELVLTTKEGDEWFWQPSLSKLKHSLKNHEFWNQHAEIVFNFSVIKGTNGRQKTYEIFHVYCVFYSGFMCQSTVIFGITKDGSLALTTLASWNCFTCRNIFQNGANDMSECLTSETAFCKKAQNYV